MKQSKVESTIEAGMNTFTGFWISYFVWICVLGFFGEDNLPDPLIITAIFTVTSMLRSYIWRRFFNADLHKLVKKGVAYGFGKRN